VRRSVWIGIAATAAFLFILVARLPAEWVVPTTGPNALCAAVDGSLWSGTCSGMSIAGNPLGDVSWELHPLQLFLGRLAAHATAARGAAQVSSDVELGFGGRLTARGLHGELPLEPSIIPGLPASLTGNALLELPLVQLEKGVITQLVGRIELHNLVDHSGASTALGSYVIEFPAGASGDPIGKLHDLPDGPLAVEGTMHLTRQPGFELQGLVTARPGAPPELVNNIRFLGSPDALGRRPFSVSGSL
jgi:general secretion pathway protein N